MARARRWIVAGTAASMLASAATAQSSRSYSPSWTFGVSLGGYAQGNRAAVSNWLSHNAYGSTAPKDCGFDALLAPVCDAPVSYPQASSSELVGWTISVRRTISETFSIEVLGATEQGGSVTGRCDDLASPRDVRCTDRFKTVEFGGGSLATLVVFDAGRLHLGAGPAVMFANWDLRPAHLTGVWLDATYGISRFPFFVRAQYRTYQSTNLSPSQHFDGFHPSTLFVGLGVTISIDESPRS
ncbi:MAG: hypothetical protein ACREPM_25255 [Gemmatimonadaceae bacterium]